MTQRSDAAGTAGARAGRTAPRSPKRSAAIAERPRPPLAWYVAFAISSACDGHVLRCSIGYLIATGIGVWGNNSPVFWAFDITNFVFWIGIGHAGTLISAILFLFRQKWRTEHQPLRRGDDHLRGGLRRHFPGDPRGPGLGDLLARAVSEPDVAVAELPQPAAVGRFRREHVWHGVAAVLVSGHDSRPGDAPRSGHHAAGDSFLYGLFALGWRGSASQWHVYERAYLLLAALATPLVLSVHSVVSFDFAVAQLPGWHSTIFPPYFVAGAIFSGFAMVVTLMVPARAFFGLKSLITMRHLDNMNKHHPRPRACMVGYAYGDRIVHGLVQRQPLRSVRALNRALGPYAWAYWLMVACNVLVPQLFWFQECRTTPWLMWIIAVLVNVGMWLERFVIIVASLSRDFLPSSWGMYRPTLVDMMMLVGSFGLFFTLFLLFCRYLPMVAMAEVKGVLPPTPTGGDEE